MEGRFNKARRIHFIGIGGIGMSALAQYFLSEGKEVYGSDLSDSPVTDLLKKKGIKVFFNQKTENINPSLDLIIYTLAVDKNNPELIEAKNKKIPILSYPEALGLISEGKYTIAVSGTHGKTSTTAMIAKIMVDAGLSPTVIAGSLMRDFDSNFIKGKSRYFLAEACEYKRDFLHLNPNVLVITNIEAEHLDYYKNLTDIQTAFISLVRKLKKEDFLVCDMSDKNQNPVMEEAISSIIDFSGLEGPNFKLKIPGEHNLKNAKAALAVSAIFGVDAVRAAYSLENFSGTWRRMERKGKTKKGALVFDDYAHHPTEIKATFSSLKNLFPDKDIIAVFQPHLFSRTKAMLSEFVESLKEFSESVILPIYPAREPNDPSIDSKMISEKLKKDNTKVRHFENFSESAEFLKNSFDSGYIIVTMGAGNVYKLAEKIVKI